MKNLDLLKSFIGQFDKRRKIEFVILGFFSLFTSILELFSIGLVIPFLTILFDLEFFQSRFPVVYNYFDSEDSLRRAVMIIFVVVIIISAVIRYLLFVWQTKFSHKLGLEFGHRILSNTLNEDYLEFKKIHNSQRISVLTLKLNQVVIQIILASLRISYIGVFSILVITSFVLYMPIQILYILILLFCVFTFINKFFSKKLNTYGDLINSLTNKIIKLLSESFSSHKDTIIYKRNNSILKDYFKYEKKLRRSIENLKLIGAFPKYLVESIGIIGIVLFAYFNISDEASQASFLPTIGFLLLGLQRLLPLAQEMHHNITEFKGGKEVGVELLGFLKKEIIVNSKSNKIGSELIINDYLIKDLSYSYSKNLNILSNVNFNFKAGQIVGIIGESGCGKSTLMDILMGLIDFESGSVLVNGINIKETKNLLHKKISHVSQKVYLSDKSIIENISFKRSISEKEINKINSLISMCELTELVESLPDGLNTIVGENGSFLSGGQIQRIGLARALFRDPSIMFLDEFTGALDSNTESKILETIVKLNSTLGITIVFITHNHDILKYADVVVKLDKQ